MTKKILIFIAVVLVGALLGSFLGNLLSSFFPTGAAHDLFSQEMTPSLHPVHLDLRVIEVMFGLKLRFNLMSIIGVILTALLYRKFFK